MTKRRHNPSHSPRLLSVREETAGSGGDPTQSVFKGRPKSAVNKFWRSKRNPNAILLSERTMVKTGSSILQKDLEWELGNFTKTSTKRKGRIRTLNRSSVDRQHGNTDNGGIHLAKYLIDGGASFSTRNEKSSRTPGESKTVTKWNTWFLILTANVNSVSSPTQKNGGYPTQSVLHGKTQHVKVNKFRISKQRHSKSLGS